MSSPLADGASEGGPVSSAGSLEGVSLGVDFHRSDCILKIEGSGSVDLANHQVIYSSRLRYGQKVFFN